MFKEVGEMARSRRGKAKASARTEGARRATGARADGALDGAGPVAARQRRSARGKRDVVLRLLPGESRAALSRNSSCASSGSPCGAT